ncbi:hypothetical protein FOA52_005718 [Chlamydomonas sp. UWO 241]|nr:hypothetical protein FOA52_005718 [Chlamydomonas sp. UWO 241]
MGGACCKEDVVELNPDGTPKDPQDLNQKMNDPRDLRTAAKAGDWTQMRLLVRRMPAVQINQGATKDEGDPSEIGNTPLHFAVSINHPKAVRKLVRYAHAVSPRNAEGKLPIHMAFEAGKIKVASFLLSKGADINAADANGGTPFLNVVASGRRHIVDWALGQDKVIDYDTKDKNGNTAVLYAAKYGWNDHLREWVAALKSPAATLNVVNSEGETVLGCMLKFAASRLIKEGEALALTKQLLAAGAVASLPAFKEKVPPLHLAAASNMTPVFDAVHGALSVPPTALVDALRRTALHYAAASGAVATAEALLGLGLRPDQLDAQRDTPLHLASMRGQAATVKLLLERAPDKVIALTTPNKAGLSVYHLSLLSGNSASAQATSLAMVEQLGGPVATEPVWIKQGQTLKDGPLLMAIQGHQEKVVKRLLELQESDVHRGTDKGELPLARNLASVTAATYDSDAAIFDMLIGAGAESNPPSSDNHPLLAICKNSLSNFAERAVSVLKSKGELDWDRKDARGFTPLMIAAFNDNAWLVRYIIDEAKIDPNGDSQRTRPEAPVVVGSTGFMCCGSSIYSAGSAGGQTPLMQAAKGASIGALKILLARGARPDAVDTNGQTALAYAMTLDRRDTLECARVLLAAGASTCLPGKAGKGAEIFDATGESWVHRAVRYGAPSFIKLWAAHRGCLELLASTPEMAGDMPGAEMRADVKRDYMDAVPTTFEAEVDDEEPEVQDEGDGQDSEEDEGEAGPVAEGVLDDILSAHVADLVSSGVVQTYYDGPSPGQVRSWRREGGSWFERFWTDAEEEMPPAELEEELGWADRYSYCDAGEDDIDEDDIIDAMMAIESKLGSGGMPDAQGSRDQFAAGSDSPANPTRFDSPRRTLLSDLTSRLVSVTARGPPGSPALGSGIGSPARGGPVAEGIQQLRSSSLSSMRTHELEGVSSPCLPARKPMAAEEMLRLEVAAEAEINRLAYRVALELGLTPAVMRQYGMAVPDNLAELVAVRSGPLGEGTEDPPLLSAKDLLNPTESLHGASMGLLSGGNGAKFYANEPYFQPATRYQGVPKYMDEKVWPWWPKVDCADFLPPGAPDCYPDWVRAKMGAESKKSKSMLEGAGPWNVETRLTGNKARKDKALEGPALRQRNIKWYIKSMTPEEFPLKPGQWKAVIKKTKVAITEAANRRPLKAGEKAKARSRKVWFGIPALPSRPELNLTSPMVLATRLCRTECIAALAKFSDSVNIPDGFGATPTQYAMLMLTRDRHNPEVKCLVDTLLSLRPFVSSRMVVAKYLFPRADRSLKDAIKRGEPPKVIKALELQALMYSADVYQPSDHPTVMDPLVLAMLTNDMPRVAWMVFKCAGNLNDSFVSMSDIPIYFQGLFEKMASRTRAKVYPLHIGILQKKFNSVRLLLDFGADPNVFGKEHTGNFQNDLKKKAKLMEDKMELVAEFAAEAAKSNPMERTWRAKTTGLIKMLMNMKRFICSIEIPGITRPNPWVSALHLSCRLGQAPITFLLLKRGAAPNGAGAAAFASKSPLEEALAYARTNYQVVNTMAERKNYLDVRSRAYLDETLPEFQAEQESKLADYMAKLSAKAEKVADAIKKKKKDEPRPSAEDVLSAAYIKANFAPSTLALFGVDDLRGCRVPGKNPLVIADELTKKAGLIMDILSFDFMGLAMKALAAGAKMIVRVLLAMMKAPIVHWDPALYCAHVMLYHRAPYNSGEKQTSIVLRDMVDGGSYGWLALDEAVIADSVWKETAANQITAVKANNSHGYKRIDSVLNLKQYSKACNQFNNMVENTYFNVGIANVGTAYALPGLVASLSGGRGPAGAPPPLTGGLSHLKDAVHETLSSSIMDEMLMMQEKMLSYCELVAKDPVKATAAYAASKFPGVPIIQLAPMQAWGKAQLAAIKSNGGSQQAKANVIAGWPRTLATLHVAFQPTALEIAKGKLPEWWVKLSKPKSVDEVCNAIAVAFAGFDPAQQAPKSCEGMPQVNDKGVSMNPMDLLLGGKPDSFDFVEPEFPQKALSKHERTAAPLDIVDVVKAVQACYVQKQAALMREEQKGRAAAFAGVLAAASGTRLEMLKAIVALRSNVMREQANKMASMELMDFSDEMVIDAAMSAVNFNIAANALGPNGALVVGMLKDAYGDNLSAPAVSSALVAVAKGLGSDALGQGADALLKGLQAKVPKGALPELKLAFLSQLSAAATAADPEAFDLEALELEAVSNLAKAAAVKAETATKFLDDLVQGGKLSEEGLQEMLDEGLDSVLRGGMDALLAAAKKKLPPGVDISIDDVKALQDMVVEGMVDLDPSKLGDTGWQAADIAADGLMQSVAGKKLNKLDKQLASNPLLADVYKQLKSDLAAKAKEQLDCLPDLDDPASALPDFMGDIGSIEDATAMFEGMGEQVMDALSGCDFEVLEETVLGMNLDMAVDFEAQIAAMENAHDALITVLDLIGLDLME